MRETYAIPYISAILTMMQDPDPSMQSNATSGLCTAIETAEEEIFPFLGQILIVTADCFTKYGERNLGLLCDVILCLTEAVGDVIVEKPEYISCFMPQILGRLSHLEDDSYYLFSALDCISTIVPKLGLHFQAHFEPTYLRCLRIIHGTFQAHDENPGGGGLPSMDFISSSFQAISSLLSTLGTTNAGVLLGPTIVIGDGKPAVDLLMYYAFYHWMIRMIR